MVAFGLAPFFKSEIVAKVRESPFFDACFDEAMNEVVQMGQMYIWIRFWDNDNCQAMCVYLTSIFHGHAQASDLKNAFCKGLLELNMNKLIHIGMDGPNTNWRF